MILYKKCFYKSKRFHLWYPQSILTAQNEAIEYFEEAWMTSEVP